MNKKHLYASLLLLGGTCHSLHSFDRDPFFTRMIEEMDEHMRLFESRMQEVRQEMKNAFTKVPTYQGINATIDTKNDAIIVTLSNVKSDVKEAAFHDDKHQLIVKTEHDTIKCSSHGKSIALTITQQTKQISDDKKEQTRYDSISSSSMAQSIGHEIDLSQATIEYDGDAAILTISFPIKKEKTTAIPVTKKEKHIDKNLDAKAG